MATFTWVLLMLLAQQSHCHFTRKDKSHHHYHTSAKKSFLADAMKEMEYGENATTRSTTGTSGQTSTERVAPQENNHNRNKHKQNDMNKKIVNEDHFVARIFPSKVITEFSKKEQGKVEKDKNHGDETPKLQNIHKGDEPQKNKGSTKNDESLGQNVSTSTIAPSSSLQPPVVVSSSFSTSITKTSSNSSKSESEKVEVEKINQGGKKKRPTKNIKDAISLLQAFVEKLLKENETTESLNHSSKAKPTLKQSEKKDVLKEALPIHVRPDDGQQSTIISGIKYNLAPVYRIQAKLSKDAANNNNSNPEKQQQQQHQQQQQQQQQQQEPKKQPEQQLRGQQEEEQKQNQELGSQQQQEQQQRQQQNNVQKNELQGDIEKLKQEESLLRQSLAEKELEIHKLKLQNSPSVNNASNPVVDTTPKTPNITNISVKQDQTSSNDDQKQEESSPNDDQKEMKFASLKGVPPELLMKLKTILDDKRRKSQKFVSKQEVHSRKAFETARKLVKAALAREELYKAEQDFFEKVKEMMNKTSTTNLVKANANEKNESTINNDEGSTIKDYIQQIEEQSRLEDKVRRTSPSPSPLQNKNASTTTTQSLNDSMSTKAGLKGVNSSQSTAALDLQASAAKILKQLNHTKGPDEKNVEAAAHLEEKVAEQQDEMYEKLIRQTLGKGMGGDDEDDEEDDEEEGATRNMNGESRPQEEMMGRQENYGDFQDSDEEAQSRSDIKYVDRFNKNETLPSIDEDSLLSLRDKISRPTK